MKSPVWILLPLLIFLSDLSAARTWTNKNGKTIEAELVKVDGGEAVLRKGRKEYQVKIDSLSEKDQAYIEESKHLLPGYEESGDPKASEDGEAPAESTSFPLDLNQWISGDEVDATEAAGRPIVLHQWQAHCGACPRSLREFEKIVRRKKSTGAVFLVWHSIDKIEMAKEKSESLDLDLSVYHGKLIQWNKEAFGEVVWPHVVLMNPDGEVIYMGKPDRSFDKALKEVAVK